MSRSSSSPLSTRPIARDASGAPRHWVRRVMITLLGLLGLLMATACSVDPGSGASATPSLQAHGALYVFTGGAVYALNLANGGILWRNQLAGALTGAAIGGGTVYVGVSASSGSSAPPQDVVEALNPSTGATLWRVTQSSGVLEPLAADSDAVFVDIFPKTSGPSTPSSVIEALRASDGALLWRSPHKDAFSSIATASDRALFLVASSTAKATATSSPAYSLLALNTNNGKSFWRLPLQSQPSTPVLSGGALYLTEQYDQQPGPGSTPTSHILAVRTSDGKTIWSATLADVGAIGGVVIGGGAVCYSYEAVNGPGSGIGALDATDGSLKWQLSTSADRAAPLASSDGILYSEGASGSGPSLTRTMRAYVISTGQALFDQSFPNLPAQSTLGAINQPPQVFGGNIYFVAPESPAAGSQPLSVVFALNTSNGDLMWDRSLNGAAVQTFISS